MLYWISEQLVSQLQPYNEKAEIVKIAGVENIWMIIQCYVVVKGLVTISIRPTSRSLNLSTRNKLSHLFAPPIASVANLLAKKQQLRWSERNDSFMVVK